MKRPQFVTSLMTAFSVSNNSACEGKPVLCTPWLASGSYGTDANKLVATPIPDGNYQLELVAIRHHPMALFIATQNNIIVELSTPVIVVLNKMEAEVRARGKAAGIVSLSRTGMNYRKYAEQQGLVYNIEEGTFVTKESIHVTLTPNEPAQP